MYFRRRGYHYYEEFTDYIKLLPLAPHRCRSAPRQLPLTKNNDFVLSNGEFFELKPGRNKVQCTGLYLNRVWITPNWWTV